MRPPFRGKKYAPTRHNKCKNCRVSQYCLPAKIPGEHLAKFSQLKMKSILLKKGEYLSRQSHDINTLYAIRSGTLKSFYTKPDGNEYIMGFQMPPNVFGWESMDRSDHSLSLMALDHCNICALPRDTLNQLMSDIPEIAQQILTLSGRQIRHDNLNLLRTSAMQRIASFLLQLKPHYRINRHQHYFFPCVMTNSDIANYLRLSAETLSRHLHQLQQQGVIVLKRKKIVILDIKQLSQLAEYVETSPTTL
ncbi:MAG: helix-turn-helix domain-containing protein [Gammaproteobacteria bacterium]|nr:helix-turn-helix domain-containing protein [Gammaproteobacteria bacterium]MCH9744856.1 helix-turn-helix domain-containing protein [Gammaproteobacteria bacterium]